MSDTAFENRLKSYADIGAEPGAMVERADRAVRENSRPSVSVMSGTDPVVALERAMRKQGIREGRADAVQAAMREHDILPPRPVGSAVKATVERFLPDVRWFVAQTKPAAEPAAIRALCDAGFRACAPTEARWSESHRRKVVRVRQVFPRYVFVGLVPDSRGDIDFRSPRLCDGFASFVEGASGRFEVRDTVVGDLMAASELNWIDVIATKAREEMIASRKTMSRKQFKTEGFVNVMADIMEADPVKRMRLFIERFGTEGDLRGIERCAIAET